MAVRKTKEGANLKRWFQEKWVDVRLLVKMQLKKVIEL